MRNCQKAENYAREILQLFSIGCSVATFRDCKPGNPYDAPWSTPMVSFEAFYDTTSNKQLLVYPGVSLPGGVLNVGGNAAQELNTALDNIFNHPNVGPFLRGDLKAVIRTLLSDPEARTVPLASQTTYGKLREPILRLVRLWRVAPGRSVNGRVTRYSHIRDQFGQVPLSAPSVFNFFKPDFAQAGVS